MFLVVYKGTQARKGAFFVLWLVAGFGTFDEDFLHYSRIRVFPVVTQTHSRFYLVDVLSAGSTASESIPFDFAFVDFHIKWFGFRQYGNRCRRGMHTPLCFGSRNALHTVNARFVFQRAVHFVAGHITDNFLESSGSTFVGTGDFQFPTFRFAVFTVHAKQVAGKDGCFIASRAATYFEDGITVVLRVGGNKQQFDFLFQFGNTHFAGISLFACHFFHFGVGFGCHYLLCLFQSVQTLYIFFAGLHNVAHIFVFLGELDITLLVCNHIRVGDEGGNFLKPGYQPF